MARIPSKFDKKLSLKDIRSVIQSATSLDRSVMQLNDGYSVRRQLSGHQMYIPDNTAVINPVKGFPYGSKWCWGIGLSSTSTEIRIYNPLFHRAGLTVGAWMGIAGNFGDIPDRNYLSIEPDMADFETYQTNSRIFVSYSYDTVAGDGTLIATSVADDAMTVPTDDAGGEVDPMRYYKIPLYILQGTYVEATDDEVAYIKDLKIYIDMIHGVMSPGLMG